MEKIKINQTEALKLLKEGTDISDYSIEFNYEKIEAIQAIELGKNNINVPEHLIYYDDTTIDFSYDQDITKEDIETGKISWMVNTTLPLDNEIKQWIKQEKIDVDKLLTQLAISFYETVKQCRLVKDLNADNADASNADFRGFLVS